MADDIGSMAVKITAITDPLRAGLNQAIQNLKAFDAQVNKTMAPPPGLRDLTGGVKDLHKDLDKVHRKAGEAKTSLASLAVKGLIAGTGFGAGLIGMDLGVGAVKELAVGSVEAAMEAEKLSAAFEVMTGSADKAGVVIDKLRGFAQTSPLGTESVMSSAKLLAAYGVEADQLLPTLRMLGDVAVGDADRLKAIAHAYGQVATTGRLTGHELREFNYAGAPLAEEVGKAIGKPKELVKSLVEEGKVGFRDVQKAFVSMTSEGGKFFGMGDRFAQTFSGSVAQLDAAWQALKREFGGALIDELGLKDATKDLGAFTERVRAGVNEIRPFLHFLGDLGRGAAQVGNEFGKAAGMFLDIQVRSLERSFPGFGRGIREMIDDLKSFKIDPDKVIAAGFDFSKTLVTGAIVLYEAMKEIGSKASDWMKPVADAAKDLRAAAEAWRQTKDGLNSGKLIAESLPGGNLAGPLTGLAQSRADREAAEQRQKGYTGGNPRERAGAVNGVPAPAADPFAKMIIDTGKALDQSQAEWLRRSGEQRVQRAIDDARSAAANRYPGGTALVGGAFDALAQSARDAAKSTDQLKLAQDSHTRALELGVKLSEHFRDPIDKFNETLGDIGFLASKNLIDDRVRSLAVAQALDDTAKDLGHSQLPTAAEYGSKEAAKLQAEAIAGKVGDDPASLLKALVEQGKEQLERARRLEGQLVDERLKGLSAAAVFEW
jgi:tape measure domain-containing protein